MQGILNSVLALFDLDLRRTTDLDDRYAARQLSQPLLQLLLVVIGSRLLDLDLDLIDAPFDVLLLAGAVDDGRVLLLDVSIPRQSRGL